MFSDEVVADVDVLGLGSMAIIGDHSNGGLIIFEKCSREVLWMS